MDKAQIETLLKDAYSKSEATRASYAIWAEKTEELSRIRATALQYGDRAFDQTEQIEALQEEIDQMAVRSSADSFDAMKKKRAALREMKAEKNDLRAYEERLLETATKLNVEVVEAKRVLDETVHGEILNPVYLQINEAFQLGITHAEMFIDSWTEAWSNFRATIGGTATPRLNAVSKTVSACVLRG